MPQEFMDSFRQQYPQYDAVPDAELAQRILTKYPQYQQHLGDIAKPAVQPSQGVSGTRPQTFQMPQNIFGRAAGALTQYAPPTSPELATQAPFAPGAGPQPSPAGQQAAYQGVRSLPAMIGATVLPEVAPAAGLLMGTGLAAGGAMAGEAAAQPLAGEPFQPGQIAKTGAETAATGLGAGGLLFGASKLLPRFIPGGIAAIRESLTGAAKEAGQAGVEAATSAAGALREKGVKTLKNIIDLIAARTPEPNFVAVEAAHALAPETIDITPAADRAGQMLEQLKTAVEVPGRKSVIGLLEDIQKYRNADVPQLYQDVIKPLNQQLRSMKQTGDETARGALSQVYQSVMDAVRGGQTTSSAALLDYMQNYKRFRVGEDLADLVKGRIAVRPTTAGTEEAAQPAPLLRKLQYGTDWMSNRIRQTLGPELEDIMPMLNEVAGYEPQTKQLVKMAKEAATQGIEAITKEGVARKMPHESWLETVGPAAVSAALLHGLGTTAGGGTLLTGGGGVAGGLALGLPIRLATGSPAGRAAMSGLWQAGELAPQLARAGGPLGALAQVSPALLQYIQQQLQQIGETTPNQ